MASGRAYVAFGSIALPTYFKKINFERVFNIVGSYIEIIIKRVSIENVI